MQDEQKPKIMDLREAEQQKAFMAEKQIAYGRAVIIIYGTLTFFFTSNPYIRHNLAYVLLAMIWLYGAYVLYFRPYEKYPVFLASWFTYLSDCIFATLWIYATGNFESPYYVMLYTSIIAVAFRFGLKVTLLTASLYTACYTALLGFTGQLQGHESLVAVRTGFIFIIGFMTYLITRETLVQTRQKLAMQELVEEIQTAQEELVESQSALATANEELSLRNDIFNHAEENAQIGSYAWNLLLDKMRYSNNMYKLLGYEPGDFEPSFNRFMIFVHPDDLEDLTKNGENILKRHLPQSGVYRIITKQGELKYCRLTGKITGEGEASMMIGTMQDITHDIRMKESLQSKNRELETNNAELASFNYIASHDLQEPVRKIHTFSKLILEDELVPDTARHYLGRITLAATRMQHLIEAFLNYSRIDRGAMVFEETDLNVVVNEAKQNLMDVIQEKEAIVDIPTLPVIAAVPLHIHQLFINLISNALKYSRPGISPHVKIRAERLSGKNISMPEIQPHSAYWHISVADNGIGFDQQYAEKIFEVFQRLHGNETYTGTGIGLAICKKIVTAHEGFIMAEGKPGEGAVFHIYLPA